MEISKEEAEKLGLIISHFRNAGAASKNRISIMLEETVGKELGAILEFYLKRPELRDADAAFEMSFVDDKLDPFLAASNIVHLDMIGDQDLFHGIANIFLAAVREKKVPALLKELYDLSYISALSLNTRASIISWIFSEKENLTDEVLKICSSPFFFPADAICMARHMINLEMYDEALNFSITNDSEELRYLLAHNLPVEYLIHLMDSSIYIREIIDDRFQKESVD